MKDNKLLIIDGSSVMFRAYHAIPELTNSKGTPTNAVYGFIMTVRKLLRAVEPDYVAVAFDLKGPTHRTEIYEDYKANRQETPETLVEQIPLIKEAARGLSIPILELEGYEADDIIGTVTKSFEGEGGTVVIATGDKDMFQLVTDKVTVLNHANDKTYTSEEVMEKMGVGPGHIIDLLGFAGDSSDNIPGVPGIGPKTAAKLIAAYGTMEEIYDNVEDLKGKQRERLVDNKDQALLSKRLATIHCDVPIDSKVGDLKGSPPERDILIPLLSDLEFMKLVEDIFPGEDSSALVEEPEVEEIDYVTVTTLESLKGLKGKIIDEGRVAISAAYSGGEGEYGSTLEGLGLSVDDGTYYIPLTGDSGASPTLLDIASEDRADSPESSLTEAEFLEVMGEGVFDGGVDLLVDDSKSLMLYLLSHNIGGARVVMDTSLASYLIDSSRRDHSIISLASLLDDDSLPYGKGEGYDLGETLALKSKYINILEDKINKRLEEDSLRNLLLEMEIPLSECLADMENRGVLVDSHLLHDLQGEFGDKLGVLERRIFDLAGTEFNVNSPKQLSDVLFNQLGLTPLKKTKSGFSTNEEVLKSLSKDHEVPRAIIEYRQLSKLKSTYVDSLIGLIAGDGRVHTSFNQRVTATGRLSSSKPNLQNIPVRTEEGRRIREVFVAREGCLLLSADYSQIELRLVAHLSGDKAFISAFNSGEDIHTSTAAEVFSLMPMEVTPELRRRAKAINFGIIYGMGPFGLSADLGISMGEAKEYIDNYLSHYGRVKRFMDDTIRGARESGYTETLYGRRRYIPELKSRNDQVRRLGERMAINTPVQGSAADLIKASMVSLGRRLKGSDLSSKPLLQIHDELIYEVPESEVEEMEFILREVMEGEISLKVPVIVNVKSGPNWKVAE